MDVGGVAELLGDICTGVEVTLARRYDHEMLGADAKRDLVARRDVRSGAEIEGYFAPTGFQGDFRHVRFATQDASGEKVHLGRAYEARHEQVVGVVVEIERATKPHDPAAVQHYD